MERTLVAADEKRQIAGNMMVEKKITGTGKYRVPCQGRNTSSTGLLMMPQTFSTTLRAVSSSWVKLRGPD
jgi:hypothetical protein